MPNGNIGLPRVGLSPRADPRVRRAAQRLRRAKLAGDSILLQSNSGLETTDDGLSVVTQGVIGIDSSGVKLNIGADLENDGSNNLRLAEATKAQLQAQAFFYGQM